MNSAWGNAAFAQTPGKPAQGSAPAPAPATTSAPTTPTEAPPAPPSEATKKAARQAYAEGQKAYEAGDFQTATDNFIKANQLIPSPHAQYWTAMSKDKLGNVSETIAAFETFLNNPGAASIGEDKLTTAKERLDALYQIPATVKVVTVPETATVTVNERPVPSEAGGELKLPRGEHRLVVSAEGYQSEERQLIVNPGDAVEQRFELVKLAPPAPAPEPVVAAPAAQAAPPPEPKSKVPAYVTLGVAGASAIVGTVFGLKALSAENDFKKNPSSARADDVERNALIADMAFGVTVTLGITGVVLLLSDEPEESVALEAPKPARRLQVTPYASHRGGGVLGALTF